MPYIGTRVTTKISPEKEKVIKEKLGKAIAILPGKSERWLMTEFTDDCRIWFGGDASAPSAFIEVKVFGGEDKAGFSKLTGEITKIINEALNIAPDRIYITYDAISNWGWNGNNF